MALNNFKVPTSRLDEGQWFKIAGVDWLVRGLNQERKIKLQNLMKIKRKSAIDGVHAFNEFVFKELVKDWSGLTEDRLQTKTKNGTQYVVNDKLNKESEWFDVCDIRFHLKRITSNDVAEISACSNEDAKSRKLIQTMILDWEEMKLNDTDVECIPFSKKARLDIFTNEDYCPVLEMLEEIAYNPLRFLEKTSDKNIKYSEKALDEYFISADKNELANEIYACSLEKDEYRQELIEKDVELAKK